jgi:hypothetical protein
MVTYVRDLSKEISEIYKGAFYYHGFICPKTNEDFCC